MKIHHTHPSTGEFLGSGDADPNPLEPGEWLIPAHAYTKAPPDCPAGSAVLWGDGDWFLVPDWRGPVFSTESGLQSRHEDLGDLPDGLTHLPPPSIDHHWADGAWVLDEALRTERHEQLERLWRNSELDSVKWLRERHRDELEVGLPLTLSPDQFAELMGYIQSLRDWPQSNRFPDSEQRPEAPLWTAVQNQ